VQEEEEDAHKLLPLFLFLHPGMVFKYSIVIGPREVIIIDVVDYPPHITYNNKLVRLTIVGSII
jgi:hypothetical protein